jgi:16S rRNA (cytosine1402-N4)-methyltransferase
LAATGHIPVLFQETLGLLDPAPGEVFLDGTTGAGGHAAEIARRIGPEGVLVCADEDPSMLAIAMGNLAPFPWVRAVRSDFSDLEGLREAAGGRRFDGMLLDLGISSLQLDDPSRGFTFREEGPLDMRRDPGGGGPTAAEMLRDLREKELADLFYGFGEERFSRRIARVLVERRRREPVRTTTELAALVASAIPRKAWPRDIHPATRVFQALRIAVNRELSSLEAFLDAFPEHLSPGGRVAVISFHSLEDRLVKTAFRAHAQGTQGRGPALRLLTRKPVVPTEQESRENPRARSAKLRAARKELLEEETT